MLEQELFTLVRSALLAEMPAGVRVLQKNNPVSVGASSGPAIYMEVVVPAQRVGHLGRRDRDKGSGDMEHSETQWFETTLQISALARLVEGQPSAADYCRMASDILQSDKGLAVLASQRVRPLRITTSRTVYFTNDAQQYEANPSFDIVLSHVQIKRSVTSPVAAIVGNAGSV